MRPIPSVVTAEYRGGHCIHLRFDDGLEKTVDFRPWLRGPMFAPLHDPEEFRRFRVEAGAIAWPNGADIAPETLHAAPSTRDAA